MSNLQRTVNRQACKQQSIYSHTLRYHYSTLQTTHHKYKCSISPHNNLNQLVNRTSTIHDHYTELRRYKSSQYTDIPSEYKSVSFALSSEFVSSYAHRRAPFGFNGLGELVYRRTYSRRKSNGSNEQWYETVERVVNGCYNMQKEWIQSRSLHWNECKAQRSAQEMYKRIYSMKFLPPGRGLWAMGSPITEKRKLYAALNNCAFVSTADLHQDSISNKTASKPFKFLMDASMLGVGVGFDTKGADSIIIHGPQHNVSSDIFVIEDSREGWVDSTEALLNSYFYNTAPVEFDYSLIRPFGTLINGFGGIASGPAALQELHVSINETLSRRIGCKITLTDIVDIMNFIGKCVVAGNVRRTAEIAFGDANNTEYLNLKNYQVNPSRASWGWTSNNSVYAELGMDYGAVCDRIVDNGEPGFAWLENMKNYARMNGHVDTRDYRASGGNPCLEQTLESFEMCCLVETFPARHDSLADYLITLKYAYLYAKTVTLGQTQWPETNAVMQRNRRIGCSVSGIAQFLTKHNLHELQRWLTTGYNTIQKWDQSLSEWLVITPSIKTTSVKPSGTVSLLAGSTPGMHYPEARHYIRRVRLSHVSELLAPLREAGYKIEAAYGDEKNTVVVEIPVDVGENIRTVKQVSMWEQLALAAFLQRYWADNQVSCTVTFDPDTESQHLQHALNYYQYQLKGVSFLPRLKLGAYKQMPYEEITHQQYVQAAKLIKPLSLNDTKTSHADATPDRFCDGMLTHNIST